MLLHWLKLDIRSRSIDFGNWPDRLYMSNDLTGVFPSHRRNLSIEVERASAADSLDLKEITHCTGTFAEIPLCGGMCFYRDGRFYSECRGEFQSRTEFDPVAGTIRMNIGGRYDEMSPEAALPLVVKPIMQSFVLPFFQLKSLHAAVVRKDDVTLMLAGPGGAGKSTTALRLMAGGYTLLSDDTALFTHRGGVSFALSSLDSAHATNETLDLIPGLREHTTGGPDHRGKYNVSVSTIQPSAMWREPKPVTHFVQLSRQSVSRVRLVESSKSHATRALLAEAMTVFRPAALSAQKNLFEEHAAFSFDVITSLMRDARTLNLEFADHHLESLPDILGQLAW